MKLDKIEKTILSTLQTEGRISNVELATRVGISESPCFRRVKALEEAKLIEGYGARLNQRALGLQVTAFVQVSLEKQGESVLSAFLEQVKAEEHIIECHAMSGSHDYLLKVVANNIDHFSVLSMQHILKFPGVINMESNFSLLAVKDGSPLPVS